MSFLFYGCESLLKLPDISKWDTSSVTNISNLFNGLRIENIPDISKWNSSNFNDISYLFYNCKNLKALPDISKWDTFKYNKYFKFI